MCNSKNKDTFVVFRLEDTNIQNPVVTFVYFSNNFIFINIYYFLQPHLNQKHNTSEYALACLFKKGTLCISLICADFQARVLIHTRGHGWFSAKSSVLFLPEVTMY